MKKIKLLILMLIISSGLSAQINNGLFLIEGGINLGRNNAFIGTNGISFGSTDNYAKEYSSGVTHSYLAQKNFNYSIAPKIGYAIFKNFVVGADLQYHKNIHKLKNYERSTDRYRSTLYGVFVRQYFGKGKLLPIIEAGLGFGLSKSNEDDVSPGGGQYQDIERRNLFYLSGAAGVSYSVNSKFKINLLANVQQTTERPISTENFHFEDSKIINFDQTIVLSFSYFFSKGYDTDNRNSE